MRLAFNARRSILGIACLMLVLAAAGDRVHAQFCMYEACTAWYCECERPCWGSALTYDLHQEFDWDCWPCGCLKGYCIKRDYNGVALSPCYDCCWDYMQECYKCWQ